MRKLIYIPIIGIIIGEFLILYEMIFYGMGIHVINLLLIICLIIIFDNLSSEIKNILQSMILLPLLRIVIISIPQLFTDVYIQYLLVLSIILMSVYSVIKNQQISFKKLETNIERFYAYIFTAILLWIGIVMVEQYVNIISNVQTFSQEDIYEGEKFVSIFLLISFSISLLILNTKYWNKYVSNTFSVCNSSLLLVFIIIVVHKIMNTVHI